MNKKRVIKKMLLLTSVGIIATGGVNLATEIEKEQGNTVVNQLQGSTTENEGVATWEAVTSGDGQSVIVKGYLGSDTDLVIPETMGGKPVKAISANFNINHDITSLTIPASVTEIEVYNDYGMSKLLFSPNLKEINVSEDNEVYYSVDGILYKVFYEEEKKEDDLLYRNTELIRCPAAYEQENVTVDSEIVGDYAFFECKNVKNVGFAKMGVTEKTLYYFTSEIGKYAFAGLNIETICLPNSIRSIPEFAFKNCNKLKNVELPSGITTIGNEAFANCESLDSIFIPYTVSKFGDITYDDNGNMTGYSKTGIFGMNSVTIICDEGSHAEEYAIFIGFEYTTTGQGYTFSINNDGTTATVLGYNGSETNLVIPESYKGKPVTTIPADFEINSNIVSVTIPASVNSIEIFSKLFMNPTLESIYLDEYQT